MIDRGLLDDRGLFLNYDTLTEDLSPFSNFRPSCFQKWWNIPLNYSLQRVLYLKICYWCDFKLVSGIRVFYNIWSYVDIAGISITRTKADELIKILYLLFYCFFDVFLSVNITFSYAGKNMF